MLSVRSLTRFQFDINGSWENTLETPFSQNLVKTGGVLTQNSLLKIDLAQQISGLKQKTALLIYIHYELYLLINIRYKYWVSPEYKQSQTEKRKGSNCGRSLDYNLLENIYADWSSQILCIQSDRALKDLKGKLREKKN